MKHIPLPNELPQPAELPELPPQILHSTTVETLLQQNQDLMTRLSIHLRRSVDLEAAISDKEERIKVLTYQKETLSEEFEVISEKFRTLSLQYEKLKSERENTEKRFAEFSSEQNATQDRLQDENLLLRQVIRRYQKYRLHVRRLLRPAFKEKLRLEVETQSQRREIENFKNALSRYKRYHFRILTRIRPWVKSLESRNSDLSYQCFTLDKKVSDLNHALQAQQQKFLDLRAQFEKDQTRLVEYHEAKFKETEELLLERVEQLRLQTQRADLATQTLEALRERQADIENRMILAERTAKELENKNQTAAHTSEQQQTRLQKLLEVSVQELEEVRVKENAAQRLNRKLSSDLSELRKENEQLRLRLRNAQSEAQKQIAAMVQIPATNVTGEPPRETQLLNRIERILAEIQSGHSHIDFISEKKEEPKEPTNPTRFEINGNQLMSERGDLEDLV